MLHIIKKMILINVAMCFTAEEIKQKEIEALEKEKTELLKKIHSAIDDSVDLLKQANTTQDMQGVGFMLELKQRLGGRGDSSAGNLTMEEGSGSELENRRKMKENKVQVHLRKPRHKDRYATKIDKVFDVEKVLYGKKLSPEKIKKLIISRLAMQKRLDEWILQKEIEKAKIRERYLANQRLVQSGLLEKCPRFGYKKRKKYRRSHGHINFSSSSVESNGTKHTIQTKKPKLPKKYPCCRKCCKKSYLGCL